MTGPPFHPAARLEFDIYLPEFDDIRVVAIAHERQEPEYWRDRTVDVR